MLIDIYSDTVCPWCRIGKKNLFDALSERNFSEDEVTIRWHAFLLNADAPPEGLDFQQSLAQKMGGPERMRQIFEHTTQAGAAVDVKFRFERVTKSPNTILSHQLIALTPEQHKNEMVEAIMKAYFEDGADIGSLDVLVGIAESLGQDGKERREQLQSGAARDEVMSDLATARKLGIRGVPFFVFNNKLAVTGAQPVDGFLQAMRQAEAGA